MPGIKELKNRIKSIGSTRKITRAMQMVSAAKMRKAQNAALNSRVYSDLAWELIHNLAQKTHLENPLLQVFPEATKTGIIVISTNKGYVGSFNTNLANKIKETEGVVENVNAELFVMGKKIKEYAVRLNKNLAADFPKSDSLATVESIYPLAKLVSDLYKTGEYKFISIVFNKFISTINQKPVARQLLPFAESYIKDSHFVAPKNPPTEYLFEPDPHLVLDNLLPRIIESQIYQAILESDASEHSARMVTMKNATEAAEDLISDYTLTYNQLRQNKITTELAEITAGKIALE
ncbi:MAG: ATP synthase F1 subunit gamma [Candidatus Doudnabacteria bacterium]|nr:ATP synthase F1 subunit gamma [Candidatus Doudnabacteria bacterium]